IGAVIGLALRVDREVRVNRAEPELGAVRGLKRASEPYARNQPVYINDQPGRAASLVEMVEGYALVYKRGVHAYVPLGHILSLGVEQCDRRLQRVELARGQYDHL